MNYGPLLFLGILLTLAGSWFGLVLVPNQQLGALQPSVNTNTGAIYPQPIPGEAAQGRELYRSLGCNYCHTQQVRPDGFGSDIQRGWGKRRSVARDYIYQKPVMLGSSRTGPDLTNIGERQPGYDWHYTHLFNPQITSKGSIMPPHAFLFKTQKIGFDGPSTNALKLTGEFAPPAGWEVVPTAEATQLVEYLRSLRSSVDIPEAPLPKSE
ncbi:MAG: cbb3-type cytochrome c oxidase subunit II [Verrucomicrobia bacterium]|nr:cbb3-type cytochrome c oxidase subunit II [Verrucomicrobiota bacterium]